MAPLVVMPYQPASAHLVMAVAWGYREVIYRPFIVSLRRTAGYRGDVALLAPTRNNTRQEALALCEEQVVHIVEFSQLVGLGYAPGALPPKLMGERFNMYWWLCAHGSYEWCLAADFRDVFVRPRHSSKLGLALPDAMSQPKTRSPAPSLRALVDTVSDGPVSRGQSRDEVRGRPWH